MWRKSKTFDVVMSKMKTWWLSRGRKCRKCKRDKLGGELIVDRIEAAPRIVTV